MKKHLVVLFACLFVVMIGSGITSPVLPFDVERLAIRGAASRQAVVLHVGLLTGIFALMQFVFAPVWGRLSDRTGRRPLVLIGIGGYVVSQVLFGLATSVWLLYFARVLGAPRGGAVGVGGIAEGCGAMKPTRSIRLLLQGSRRDAAAVWLGRTLSSISALRTRLGDPWSPRLPPRSRRRRRQADVSTRSPTSSTP